MTFVKHDDLFIKCNGCNFLEEQMFNIRVISIVYNSTEEVYEVFYKE